MFARHIAFSMGVGSTLAASVLLLMLSAVMDHSHEVQRSEVHLLARQGEHHCDILRELRCLHGNHTLSSTTVHCWMTATFTGRCDFRTVKATGRPTKLTPNTTSSSRSGWRPEQNQPSPSSNWPTSSSWGMPPSTRLSEPSSNSRRDLVCCAHII